MKFSPCSTKHRPNGYRYARHLWRDHWKTGPENYAISILNPENQTDDHWISLQINKRGER